MRESKQDRLCVRGGNWSKIVQPISRGDCESVAADYRGFGIVLAKRLNDSWMRKADFPGTSMREPLPFSIGGIFRNNTCTQTTSSAFWEYIPAAPTPTRTPEDVATPTPDEENSEPR